MDVAIVVGDRMKWKPGGVMCPHLTLEGPTASCAIHHEPWFKYTPCHVYGNPDIDPDFAATRTNPCRVGEAIQKGGGHLKVFGQTEKAVAEELEDIGEWYETTNAYKEPLHD